MTAIFYRQSAFSKKKMIMKVLLTGNCFKLVSTQLLVLKASFSNELLGKKRKEGELRLRTLSLFRNICEICLTLPEGKAPCYYILHLFICLKILPPLFASFHLFFLPLFCACSLSSYVRDWNLRSNELCFFSLLLGRCFIKKTKSLLMLLIQSNTFTLAYLSFNTPIPCLPRPPSNYPQPTPGRASSFLEPLI